MQKRGLVGIARLPIDASLRDATFVSYVRCYTGGLKARPYETLQLGEIMRRTSLLFLLLILIATTFATPLPRPTNILPNTLIISFDAKAISSIQGDITISKTPQNQIQLGLPTFDEIARKYDITDIQRRYEHVLDPEWEAPDGTHLSNVFSLTLSDDDILPLALSELSKDPTLIWADYDWLMIPEFIPNDANYPQQWHLPMLNMPEVWDYIDLEEYLYAIDGDDYKDIVIAIVDTGVKWNHPDFAGSNPTLGAETGNLWINYAEFSGGGSMSINWATGAVSGGNFIDEDGNGKRDDILGWSFASPENNHSYQDFSGNRHGTHVAGCAASIGNNGIGTTGTAMRVKMLPIRCVVNNAAGGNLQGTTQGIQYAINTAVQNNLRMVINCSFGSYGGSGSEYTSLINYANTHGVIIVASAGNSPVDMAVGNPDPNHDEHGQHLPSNIPSVIAVTSLNTAGQYSTWSSYGDNVDTVVPGEGIWAAVYIGSDTNAQNTWGPMSGTSMSSPVAAGVIATLLSVHGSLTPAEVETRLRTTGAPLNSPYYAQGKLGGGRLDAFKLIFYDVLPKISMPGQVSFIENPGNGDGIINLGETINISARLQNDPEWHTATDVTVELVCTTAGVAITGNNPISLDDLGQGETSDIFTFTVMLDRNISTLNIPFNLIFRSNQQATNVYPYQKEFSFVCNASLPSSEDDISQVVLHKALWQNYPNPFNPSTTISFDIDKNEHTVLSIYNVRGQLVTTLLDKDMPPGSHSVVWNGTDDSGNAVSSGIYFYRLVSGDFCVTQKMILMK